MIKLSTRCACIQCVGCITGFKIWHFKLTETIHVPFMWLCFLNNFVPLPQEITKGLSLVFKNRILYTTRKQLEMLTNKKKTLSSITNIQQENNLKCQQIKR